MDFTDILMTIFAIISLIGLCALVGILILFLISGITNGVELISIATP